MGFAAGPQATGGGFTAFVRIQMVVSGMGESLRGGGGMTASGRGLPARTDTARHGLGRKKDFGRQEEERGACEEMKGGNGCQLEGVGDRCVQSNAVLDRGHRTVRAVDVECT